MFARLSQDNDFLAYLKECRETETAIMVEQIDPHLIHRTQGKVKFIDQMYKLIEVARTKT